jgi:N-carbamoylputrescine amidase
MTGDSSKVRVAACQIHVSGDRPRALQEIESALQEAARGNADVACFPEACLFGWVNPVAHRLADPIPGPTTKELGRLARQHGLMIALGMAERDGSDLYNSVVLIDSDGELLLKHRKTNILTELMEPPYSVGTTAASAVDTRCGRIGLLICADTFQDETVDATASENPQLLLVPYGWAAPTEDWPDHGKSLASWVTRTAQRVGVPVIGVDGTGVLQAGPWQGHVLGGQSVVSDSRGEVRAILADRKPDLRIFDVDLRTGLIETVGF